MEAFIIGKSRPPLVNEGGQLKVNTREDFFPVAAQLMGGVEQVLTEDGKEITPEYAAQVLNEIRTEYASAGVGVDPFFADIIAGGYGLKYDGELGKFVQATP
jgi:hypothetical protein